VVLGVLLLATVALLAVAPSAAPLPVTMLTALLGLITFVVGQIIVKLFEPALDLRSSIGELSKDIILMSHLEYKTEEHWEKTRGVFSQHAASLHEKLFRIAWYEEFFQHALQLPPKEDVENAAERLLLLDKYWNSRIEAVKDYPAMEEAEIENDVMFRQRQETELMEQIESLLRIKLH
jgi:hypothetical protein